MHGLLLLDPKFGMVKKWFTIIIFGKYNVKK